MKLILCPKCNDLFRLTHEFCKCECGASAGNYTDNLNAVTYGKAIPIGFLNHSFVQAVLNQPESGMGKEFTAFVIPKSCPTITHSKRMKHEKIVTLLPFQGDEPDDSLK